jgi:hypothetical protein
LIIQSLLPGQTLKVFSVEKDYYWPGVCAGKAFLLQRKPLGSLDLPTIQEAREHRESIRYKKATKVPNRMIISDHIFHSRLLFHVSCHEPLTLIHSVPFGDSPKTIVYRPWSMVR